MNKTVKIDGKTYKLAYTNEALCAMEDIMAGDELLKAQTTRPAHFIRHMMWGALIENHPDVTVEEAGKIADAYAREHNGDVINGLKVAGRDALLFLFRDVQITSGLMVMDETNAKAEMEKVPLA